MITLGQGQTNNSIQKYYLKDSGLDQYDHMYRIILQLGKIQLDLGYEHVHRLTRIPLFHSLM